MNSTIAIPETLKGPGLLYRTVYIMQSQRKEVSKVTISERTLRQWRKHSLTMAKNIKKENIPSITSYLHDRILKMTQELLDQHLLRK